MFKKLLLLIGALLLAGCDEEVITKAELVTMEVVSVDLRSKTNSKVNLKVVGVNQVYTEQRLGCNKEKAKKIKIGSKWDVIVEDFKYGDKYGTRLVGTYAICDLSQ